MIAIVVLNSTLGRRIQTTRRVLIKMLTKGISSFHTDLFQLVVHFVSHWFKPLVAGTLLHILMVGEMLEPSVFGSSVPVLRFCGNGDDGAGSHLNGFLAPLLIPAAPGDADEHLHRFVVDVPVVATARLEGDVHHPTAHVGQKALTGEILAEGIRLTFRPPAVQHIALLTEPSTQRVDSLLRVAHVDGSLLVGCQLWGNTLETAQGGYGHYLAVGSRELVASEDVAEEVRLQVIVVLWTECVVERTAREFRLHLRTLFQCLCGVIP